jgi:hypothetical protein
VNGAGSFPGVKIVNAGIYKREKSECGTLRMESQHSGWNWGGRIKPTEKRQREARRKGLKKFL